MPEEDPGAVDAEEMLELKPLPREVAKPPGLPGLNDEPEYHCGSYPAEDKVFAKRSPH